MVIWYSVVETISRCGGMADAADSKSVDGDIVRVQVPPPASDLINRRICKVIFLPKVFKNGNDIIKKYKRSYEFIKEVYREQEVQQGKR